MCSMAPQKLKKSTSVLVVAASLMLFTMTVRGADSAAFASSGLTSSMTGEAGAGAGAAAAGAISISSDILVGGWLVGGYV